MQSKHIIGSMRKLMYRVAQNTGTLCFVRFNFIKYWPIFQTYFTVCVYFTMWCATSRRQHQIPREPTRVGTDFVQSVRSVRDLGIYIDSEASMKAHVSRTVSSCFNALRQICSIRRSVTRPVLQSLVVCLVLSGLDTTATQHTPACLPANWADFSQSRMLARGSSSRQTSTITFHRYYAISTGCGRRGESTTRLLFSYIGVYTDLLRRTCLLIYSALRTCRRDNDYGHGRRTR